MKALILILVLTLSTAAFAGKAAMVKLMKGDAYLISGEKKLKLKINDWVDEGSVIKTDAKSFVRLVFLDKSQMNISASSELKIERFHKKDAGVIGLIKGQIRSQVSKDYLQINGKDRSKLFIKTKNAVMGIRGTDFMITTNGQNTAAILFEGEVVFNKLEDGKLLDSAKLDALVDQGVRLYPGEFSAVGGSGAPTIPALLNVNQRERLEKNSGSAAGEKGKSVVPPGLNATSVVSASKEIKNSETDRASTKAEAFTKDGLVKPVNGSSIDLTSASIVAPSADAKYDEATNTYLDSGADLITGKLESETSVTDNTLSTQTISKETTTDGRSEQIIYQATDVEKTSEKEAESSGGVSGGVTSGGTSGNTFSNRNNLPSFMEPAPVAP